MNEAQRCPSTDCVMYLPQSGFSSWLPALEGVPCVSFSAASSAGQPPTSVASAPPAQKAQPYVVAKLILARS